MINQISIYHLIHPYSFVAFLYGSRVKFPVSPEGILWGTDASGADETRLDFCKFIVTLYKSKDSKTKNNQRSEILVFTENWIFSFKIDCVAFILR